MEKEFKTIEEQIQILRARGLIVNDNIARDILKDNNYYYLINGYKNIFIQSINGEEKYKPNVTLEEIYALYSFDSELRINILKYILKIERKIDTYIAYEFSKQYGHKDYLNPQNFDSNKFSTTKISDFISDISSNITCQIQLGNKMLNHYMNNYGYVPLWVLIRIMTFGQISKFYDFMKQSDQNAVAKKFNVKEKSLKTYIHNLSVIRNVCAHDEKLYDLKLKNAITQNHIHKSFNLKLKDNQHSFGFKDLFSVMIILKCLLEKNDFTEFYSNVISDIDMLKLNIHSISFKLILNKMGFPDNYEKLLLM